MERWERQEEESTRAYEAARLYFEMGPGRSLAKVAQRCGKHVSLMGQWSRRHAWVERAEAWDRREREMVTAVREAVIVAGAEEEARQWVERQRRLREMEWERAMALVARADEILALPTGEMRPTYGEAARLLDLASRLGRLALGVETERTAHSVVAVTSDEMAQARAAVEAWERERFGEE